MTVWRRVPVFVLDLLFLAGPAALAPAGSAFGPAVPPPLAPSPSDEGDEQSSPLEIVSALDVAQHGRREVEHHRPSNVRSTLHHPRRHHAPAVPPLAPPAPFRAAANPPLRC